MSHGGHSHGGNGMHGGERPMLTTHASTAAMDHHGGSSNHGDHSGEMAGHVVRASFYFILLNYFLKTFLKQFQFDKPGLPRKSFTENNEATAVFALFI